MMLFYVMILTKSTKVGMIGQNYNVKDRTNFRAELKRFTHKTMKKCIMSILRRCKHRVIFPSVNSTDYGLPAVPKITLQFLSKILIQTLQ